MKANTYVVKPFGISEVKVIALKGDPGTPTQEQVNTAVDEYMTEHPEAQIPDGSITEQKLSSDVVATLNEVDNKADKVGSYPDLIAGAADNLLSSSYQTDRTPYILRRTPYGARERGSIVGGSIVWNQLCNNASVTVVNGHKYLLKKDGAYSIGASTGTALTGLTVGSDMVFDLTLMFGSTIADYIYTQEQATAGAGVALAKKWAGITGYVQYDAGTLMSVKTSAHKMVGYNQWDEEWELGSYSSSTGEKTTTSNYMRSKNYISVFPQVAYYFKTPFSISSSSIYIFYYDANMAFLEGGRKWNANQTTPANARYMTFSFATASYGSSTYNNDICLNISSDKNGTYEHYTVHSYPLDSSLTLRGLPKLDGDNLYYDGDVYRASGEVERRYGIVDLGTLTWAKSGTIYFARLTAKENALPNYVLTPRYQSIQDTAVNATSATNKLTSDMSIIASLGTSAPYIYVRDDAQTSEKTLKTSLDGVYLIYLLAEPTTEQAEPYTALQICDPAGTEEFVGASMPVGHETKYYADLKGKIEDIPDAPSTNGTYVLKATVSSSGVTYEWIAG